jgi:thioredoxin reductase (NADPH)
MVEKYKEFDAGNLLGDGKKKDKEKNMVSDSNLYDIAIIGGGPGGMTAGIYAGRGLLSTLILDKGALGGAVLLSSGFDNFPGFPGGISGFDLAANIEKQMNEHDVAFEMDNVISLKFLDGGPLFEIVCDGGTYHAKSVIIASGSNPRPLKAKGAKGKLGKGISICAVCDAGFYKGKDVAVVGGGDAAVEEADYLTKFANSVTIIHRRDELRARPNHAKLAFDNPKIKFQWDSVVEEVLGDQKVEGVIVRNVKTDETTKLDVDGLFVYIGSTGNTGYIDLDVEMDDWKYIVATHLCETNIPGLYAIGDVRWEPFKQVVIACGQGAQAALMADKYIKTIPEEALAAIK